MEKETVANRVRREEGMRLQFKCRLPIETRMKNVTLIPVSLFSIVSLFDRNCVCIAHRHCLKHASLTLPDAFLW